MNKILTVVIGILIKVLFKLGKNFTNRPFIVKKLLVVINIIVYSMIKRYYKKRYNDDLI